eukprot:m.214233 g.214233  ORF g.214233 m.214233 type:complete len:822 (-) comp15100_c2_seq1:251-2716(-)
MTALRNVRTIGFVLLVLGLVDLISGLCFLVGNALSVDNYFDMQDVGFGNMSFDNLVVSATRGLVITIASIVLVTQRSPFKRVAGVSEFTPLLNGSEAEARPVEYADGASMHMKKGVKSRWNVGLWLLLVFVCLACTFSVLKACLLDKNDTQGDIQIDTAASIVAILLCAMDIAVLGVLIWNYRLENKPGRAVDDSEPNADAVLMLDASSPQAVPSRDSVAPTPAPIVSLSLTPKVPQVRTTDTLEQKQYRQRLLIAKEVVETEERYVGILIMIMQVFMFPMQCAAGLGETAYRTSQLISKRYNVAASQPGLQTSADWTRGLFHINVSKDEVTRIFLEIESIYNLHQAFLGDLQARMRDWAPDTPLADVFLKFSSYFANYELFARNFEQALTTLAEIRERPSVKEFFEACMEQPRCGKLWLDDHLIGPIQRLPRYILLLRDLNKRTPDTHVDKNYLPEAIARLEKLTQKVNQSKATAEKSLKMVEIQRMVKYCPSIVTPSRMYMFDAPAMQMELCSDPRGDFFQQMQGVVLFVFNDIVMLASHDQVDSLLGRTAEAVKSIGRQIEYFRPRSDDNTIHKYKFIAQYSLLDVFLEPYTDDPDMDVVPTWLSRGSIGSGRKSASTKDAAAKAAAATPPRNSRSKTKRGRPESRDEDGVGGTVDELVEDGVSPPDSDAEEEGQEEHDLTGFVFHGLDELLYFKTESRTARDDLLEQFHRVRQTFENTLRELPADALAKRGSWKEVHKKLMRRDKEKPQMVVVSASGDMQAATTARDDALMFKQTVRQQRGGSATRSLEFTDGKTQQAKIESVQEENESSDADETEA